MTIKCQTCVFRRLLFEYQDLIRIIGGILVIIFGLFVAGVLKLDFLMKERKFHISGKPAGYIGFFLVGMTFAAGWTPCIGPIHALDYGFKCLLLIVFGIMLFTGRIRELAGLLPDFGINL